jgi:peptidoglycan LD-endopeptidase CwlK
MSPRSLARLEKAHPLLRQLFISAAEDCPVHIEIGETLRPKKRQAELVAAGASWTMDSRHLAHPADGLARAVDFLCYVGDTLRWDWPLYAKAAGHIKRRAEDLGIHIVWGGDWKKLRDGPHIELSRQTYP